jgi:integral membrane protein
MLQLFTTSLGRFRLVSALEGWSFLILLGIAMPLKYIWQEPWMVQNVGMAHGVLFVLYLLLVLLNMQALRWDWGKALLAMALSVVPLGTFYVVRRMIPAGLSAGAEAAQRQA